MTTRVATSLFATLILALGARDALAQCAPAPGGLVSWWSAEGNAEDGVGGNDGTPVGGPAFAGGKVGQALSVNGSNYLRVPESPSLALSQITIEAWIQEAGGGVGTVPRIFGWQSDALEIADYFNGGNLGVYMGSIGWCDTSFRIRDAGWVHIAVTHDGTTLRVYGDGDLVASYGGDLELNPGPFFIGARWDPVENFNGLIDEVSIYDRALSAGEIQAIHAAGAAGKCRLYPDVVLADGPVAYWRLDEASGSLAADASGNGHAGVYGGDVGLGAPGAIAAGGSGAAFDVGGGSHVVVPMDPAFELGTEDFTLEVWAEPQPADQFSSLVSHNDGWGPREKWALQINRGFPGITFHLNGAIGYVALDFAGALLPTGYNHIVLTRSGSSFTAYLNGAPLSTVSWAGTIPEASCDVLTLGRGIEGCNPALSDDPAFTGRLDEVAIYKKALTAAQVLAHYNAGTASGGGGGGGGGGGTPDCAQLQTDLDLMTADRDAWRQRALDLEGCLAGLNALLGESGNPLPDGCPDATLQFIFVDPGALRNQPGLARNPNAGVAVLVKRPKAGGK